MRYTIMAPEQLFTGEVAGVAFARGKATMDSAAAGSAAALAYFARKGYTVEPVEEPKAEPAEPEPAGPFDPARHGAPAVLAYLADADEVEAERVLDAEAAGKARKGILDQREAILAGKKGNGQ